MATLKNTRVYGYTTEKNGNWIVKTAKKLGVTKASLIHSLVDHARINKTMIPAGIKQVAAKKTKK